MSSPKIHLLSLTFNEEKYVRQFLEHYSFCTSVTIYDNLSTDRTVEIIKEVRPDAEVIPFDSKGVIDNFKFLEIKNHAWKQWKDQFDWQIVVDCDEYIYNPFEDTFEEYFRIVRERSSTLIPTVGFAMNWDTYDPEFHKKFKDGFYDPMYGKFCIFNPQKLTDINYSIGCHDCKPVGELSIAYPQLYLLHARYFGFTEWQRRNNEYAARVDRIPGAYMYKNFQAWVTDAKDPEEQYKANFEKNRIDLTPILKFKGKRFK